MASNPPAPAAPPPLTDGALAHGSIALSLATFMNILDTSIANVSIPAISGDLAVSPDQGTWVITSFAVANAISLPLTGWLTMRYGQVRLFLASTLLLASFPKKKAGIALAIWGMTTLVAPVVGPVLGGWITDNISWPWIFYINIPVGLIATAITWMIYRKRETPTARVPVDGIGLGLVVLWVGALQIVLDRGKDLDWFGSTQIVTLAIVSVVGFALFIVWELTDRHP